MSRVPQVTADDLDDIHVLRARLAPVRIPNREVTAFLAILTRRCMELLLLNRERRALALHVWRTHGAPLPQDAADAETWETILLRHLGRHTLATAA